MVRVTLFFAFIGPGTPIGCAIPGEVSNTLTEV